MPLRKRYLLFSFFCFLSAVFPFLSEAENGSSAPVVYQNGYTPSGSVVYHKGYYSINGDSISLGEEALKRGRNIQIAGESVEDFQLKAKEDLKYIAFNFDKARITDVIMTVAELLKINYIIDEGVSGSITINTTTKIPLDQLFPVFQQVLAINNVAMVKTGELYRFVPMKEVDKHPIAIYYGRDAEHLPDEDRMIVQIIPFLYMPPQAIINLLQPMISANGSIYEAKDLNALVLTDLSSNVRRLLSIINALDIKNYQNTKVDVYAVKNARVGEMIKDLQTVFVALGYSEGISFIEAPMYKSIIVVNKFPHLASLIDEWIEKLDSNTVKIRLIKMEYVSPEVVAADLKKVLVSLGYDKKVEIIPLSRLNSLLVVNPYPDVQVILRNWIKKLDQPLANNLHVQLYPLQSDDGEKLLKDMETIFTALGYKTGNEGDGVKFLYLPRINSLLTLSSIRDIFPLVEQWLDKLDSPISEDKYQVFIYQCQNTNASDIAPVLQAVYKEDAKDKIKDEAKRRAEALHAKKDEKPVNPLTPPELNQSLSGQNVASNMNEKGASAKGNTVAIDSEIVGKITFLTNEKTNSIIIKTLPKNYPKILETIQKLDVKLQQVQIKVFIAEATVSDSKSFGIDWVLKGGGATTNQNGFLLGVNPGGGVNATNPGQLPIATQGIQFLVGNTASFMANIQANANLSNLEVLSTPSVVTTDNIPAKININTQIPETQTISNNSPTNPIITTNTIYRTSGIQISVTPNVNREGDIHMKINLAVSQPNTYTQPDGKKVTAYSDRNVTTEVTIKDQQSLFIGGLKEKMRNPSRTGLPFLVETPASCLFGKVSDSYRETELFFIITPTILGENPSANKENEQFRRKVEELNKRLNRKSEILRNFPER